MPDHPHPAIEITDLTLQIRSSRLLDGASLRADHGERIAIMGANGAGKTTLLKCLLGLRTADSGSILLDGIPLEQYSRKALARTIGYVPQQLPDGITFTAREFIMMSRYAHSDGFTPRSPQAAEAVLTSLEQTGIPHLADRSLATLSGGERQKVSIAAVLVQETPILLLDEPSAHLDPGQQDAIQTLLCEIGRARQTAILVVTHDLNWAATNFDRIVGMSSGRILADTSPAEFMSPETLQSLFGNQWEIFPHPRTGCPMPIPSRTPEAHGPSPR